MARRGRPTKYTPKLARQICDELAKGRTLLSICEDEGFPDPTTIRNWAISDIDGFFSIYTRAREMGCDAIVDDTFQIADTPREGIRRVDTLADIWICPACSEECRWLGSRWVHSGDRSALCAAREDGSAITKPDKRRVVTGAEIIRGDAIDRARMMIDTRKWYVSKIASRRYGDRIEVATVGQDDGMKELADAIRNSPRDNASP